MYASSDFACLAIRRISKNNWVKLMCLRATADCYGWSRVFPDFIEAQQFERPGYLVNPYLRKNYRGYRGHRLRICRHDTRKQGHPAGLTNCFRVSLNCSTLDMYAIAQAVGIDYGWMENKNGYRRSRNEWESLDLPDSYCHLDLRAADCFA